MALGKLGEIFVSFYVSAIDMGSCAETMVHCKSTMLAQNLLGTRPDHQIFFGPWAGLVVFYRLGWYRVRKNSSVHACSEPVKVIWSPSDSRIFRVRG